MSTISLVWHCAPTCIRCPAILGTRGYIVGAFIQEEFGKMKILVSIAIIAIIALFCIGAVNSSYNCVTHLCGSLTHAINFVGDFLHTEMAGASIVAKWF